MRSISDLWATAVEFFRSGIGFEGKETTTPSNPDSGYRRIYPKSDGLWYDLSSGGTETALGGSGGSPNLDGGKPDSNYGGISPIDGGTP
jgi:hypothetical protein